MRQRVVKSPAVVAAILMLPGPALAADSVKVGVLQSLSGTMAISEVSVKNAEMMAIDEINAAGGVLGRKIEAVVEDGASDPAIFFQKATKLVQDDGAVYRVRRLDVCQPQSHVADISELEEPSLVSGCPYRKLYPPSVNRRIGRCSASWGTCSD
jgi:hypothetical protein